MRLFKRGWKKKSPVDSKLSEAERRVADLECRSDRVAESLQARLRRNHWGETVAEIARRESGAHGRA